MGPSENLIPPAIVLFILPPINQTIDHYLYLACEYTHQDPLAPERTNLHPHRKKQTPFQLFVLKFCITLANFLTKNQSSKFGNFFTRFDRRPIQDGQSPKEKLDFY